VRLFSEVSLTDEALHRARLVQESASVAGYTSAGPAAWVSAAHLVVRRVVVIVPSVDVLVL